MTLLVRSCLFIFACPGGGSLASATLSRIGCWGGGGAISANQPQPPHRPNPIPPTKIKVLPIRHRRLPSRHLAVPPQLLPIHPRIRVVNRKKGQKRLIKSGQPLRINLHFSSVSYEGGA